MAEAAQVLIPPGLPSADLDSYVGDWWGWDGIDMADDEQLSRLERWREFDALFADLRADQSINPSGLRGSYIQNGWYPTPDAEAYAAMIAEFRPGVILEIGGGYSTLIARRTLEFVGLTETQLIVVDPAPRIAVNEAADDIVYGRVEELGLEKLPLDRPVLLFIDSSHVTRTGGDVPFLYTKVIPKLVPQSIVHVHDISLPFDYPPRKQARFYTEQYVLHALLIGSARFRVAFAGEYLGHRYPEQMQDIFGKTVPAEHGGASFWFLVQD